MKKILLTSKLLLNLLLLIAFTIFSTGQTFAAANAVSSAAGERHSLILKSDGTVWTWGSNQFGQLGDGTTTDHSVPSQVNGLTDVIRIAAGIDYCLALKSNGTVWTWGNNNTGQLGDGTQTNRHTPVQVTALTDVIAIATGGSHNLAIKRDGTLYSWGKNNYGQLGDGTQQNFRPTPVQVNSMTSVIAIAAGDSHSLAVKRDGTLYSWGNNYNGRLGDGTTSHKSYPVKINLKNIVAVSSGADYSLALDADGYVHAWGGNNCGQLGDGTGGDRVIPVLVSGLSNIVEIASGSTAFHSLALDRDGNVYAWGKDTYGQLGDGLKDTISNTPQLITKTKP